MSEQTITKTCTKCKQINELSNFSKQKAGKGGIRSWCKACCAEHAKMPSSKLTQKIYRESEKGIESCKKSNSKYHKRTKGKDRKKYRSEHPERKKANEAVNNAVRYGKLPRIGTIKCKYCNKQAQHYHHCKGYAKEHRLDVEPVCVMCHKNHLD